MSWLASILVAILTAATALFASAFVASEAVNWYGISGFEGGSGYFMVSLALMGMIAGFVIGLVVSRVVAATSHPGFWKALGLSLLVMGASLGVTGAVARLRADVPPRIDGQALMLAVELRYPASEQMSPAQTLGERRVRLGSETGDHVLRKSELGPLWDTDARKVDGRWIVPGAVEVFTSRGKRVLDIVPDTLPGGKKSIAGVMVPLPAWPGNKDTTWSEWMPHAMPGAAPLPDGFQFRYRVQNRSAPLRTETVGAFDVLTIANGFFESQINGTSTWNAIATFVFRHHGQPVTIEGITEPDGTAKTRFERVDAVAVIPGASPALLIHVDADGNSGYVYLLKDDNGTLRTEFVDQSYQPFNARELTNDAAQYRVLNEREVPRGRIDRTLFARPAMYLFQRAVLDTRTLAIHLFHTEPKSTAIPAVKPLGISPDEHSFVEFAYADGSDTTPVLVVTNFVSNATYEKPVDPTRMRYAKLESLDPAWLAWHFQWKRDASGVDQLEARPNIVPLPWRGELTTDGDGQQSYRLEKGDEPLRRALMDFLIKRFGAERMPADSGAYQYPMRVEGRVLNVSNSGEFRYVMVSTENGHKDDGLIARIGKAFDAELATGKYDGLFRK